MLKRDVLQTIARGGEWTAVLVEKHVREARSSVQDALVRCLRQGLVTRRWYEDRYYYQVTQRGLDRLNWWAEQDEFAAEEQES